MTYFIQTSGGGHYVKYNAANRMVSCI